jgi:hypothetical protein
VVVTWYTTPGAVAISARSNSRSSRACTMSACSRPRKPQRKPKPSASLVSGSKLKAASLRRSFSSASRSGVVLGVGRVEAAEHDRHRRLEAGMAAPAGGRRGHGVADLRVGDLLDAGGEPADLADAQPSRHGGRGAEEADLVDLDRLPVEAILTLSPWRIVPSNTRMKAITPWYES